MAALNLSQFLAAEGDFDKPVKRDNDDLVAEEVPKAPLQRVLPTPNSECSVKSIVSEKSNKKKKSEESKQEVPVNPIVGPIVEMGFTKKSVEDAIKTLSEGFLEILFLLSVLLLVFLLFILGLIPDSLVTPETIVAWLLEHPDFIASDSETISSVYDSDTESVSEQNEVVPKNLDECVSLFFIILCVISWCKF